MEDLSRDHHHRQEIDIPCFFVCPISMQLMKDPVTVSTGITYDRESIETWLFTCKNTTCPVTKQALTSKDLTPNHTLRRLIQAWCAFNSIEEIPTPKPVVEKSHIEYLLKEAKKSPSNNANQLTCLRKLRSIAYRNETCRSRLQSAGTLGFLLSVISNKDDNGSREEALQILQKMGDDLSDSDLRSFLSDDGEIMGSLMQILENGNHQARGQVIILLRNIYDVADPDHLIGSKPELFEQIVHILKDRSLIPPQATKASLKLLMELCPWGRNRIKAAEAGTVFALIDMLLDDDQRVIGKRVCELVLTVLDQICQCAEGRAELLRHGAGLAVVSKKILRVSNAASERAVRILGSICRHCGNLRVLQEMLQVGVVAKLCLVLQVEASRKCKERAKEVLRLHARVWKGSSCIPSNLISAYPSC